MPDNLDGLLALAITVAVVVIAVAAVALAIGLLGVLRDLRRLMAAAQRTMELIETELPPTARDLRTSAANVERLSGELEPRLERVDALLDEAEATSISLRATVEAAEEIVRGPQVAVDRARRTVRSAGAGLARGADRLRRSVEEAAGRR